MRDFVLRQGDTASPIESILLDDQGAPIDLVAGVEVAFALAPAGGGELVVDYAAADVVDPGAAVGDANRGRVRYGTPWLPDEVDTAGLFLGEWRVTWPNDEQQTFPNDGYLVVAITADVGTITAGELLALDSNLTAERAAAVLELARRGVRAWVAPATDLGALPWPDRVELVVLRQALRLARATPDTSGAVVSESLGSYTYRLARPLSLDDALELGDDLKRELLPWAPHRAKAYSATIGLDTVGGDRPVDWWARDWDTLDDAPVYPLT